eukprot:15484014-Alexandrium_andersonii.AAC.1
MVRGRVPGVFVARALFMLGFSAHSMRYAGQLWRVQGCADGGWKRFRGASTGLTGFKTLSIGVAPAALHVMAPMRRIHLNAHPEVDFRACNVLSLSLIHISEPTRLALI